MSPAQGGARVRKEMESMEGCGFSQALCGVGASYLTCSADWLGAICVFVIVFVRKRLEELYARKLRREKDCRTLPLC